MTSATESSTSVPHPTGTIAPRPHDLVPFPSDRVRLELLRGGRASCAPPTGPEATVSVVVIAAGARAATGQAIRGALTQSHPVHEVLVVGPDWSDSVRADLRAASGDVTRVRLHSVPRPGLAPAAPRARRFVRAAQYLRAALPFLTGDWITVCTDDATLEPTLVAALLQRSGRDALELAWPAGETLQGDGSFGRALWASALAALPPHDHAGWDGMPADLAWWARLLDAGVRFPAAGRAPNPTAPHAIFTDVATTGLP